MAFYKLIAMSLVDSNAMQATKAQRFKHITGVGVDLDGFLLQGRNFWNKVQSSFSFFFLQFQRDTTDRSLGNATHQMRCVSSDLIAHALGGEDGNIVDNTLVGVEVHRQAGVVLLDDRTSRFLYCFGSYTLRSKREMRTKSRVRETCVKEKEKKVYKARDLCLRVTLCRLDPNPKLEAKLQRDKDDTDKSFSSYCPMQASK